MTTPAPAYTVEPIPSPIPGDTRQWHRCTLQGGHLSGPVIWSSTASRAAIEAEAARVMATLGRLERDEPTAPRPQRRNPNGRPRRIHG